jgi:hypothetical protein
VIVVEGLAIVREVAFGLFAVGLFSGHVSPRIVPRTPQAWREQRNLCAQPQDPGKHVNAQIPTPNSKAPGLGVGSWELGIDNVALDERDVLE